VAIHAEMPSLTQVEAQMTNGGEIRKKDNRKMKEKKSKNSEI